MTGARAERAEALLFSARLHDEVPSRYFVVMSTFLPAVLRFPLEGPHLLLGELGHPPVKSSPTARDAQKTCFLLTELCALIAGLLSPPREV